MSTQYQTAPKTLRINTRMRDQRVGTIYYKGQMVPFLIRGGKIVYADRPIKLPDCAHRQITDADGTWLEFGFLSAHVLEGNATIGWTDPDHYLTLQCQNSMDMVNWHEGQFINAPGGAVIDNGDGTYWYWQRSRWPKNLKTSIIDYDLRSTRGQKTITAINLHNANITLPNFPYAVETDMTTLQNDLRAAGYTDAICSYSGALYTVDAIRHWNDGSFMKGNIKDKFLVEHTGESVTAVRLPNNSLVSLPGYPYVLPVDAAALQSDLIAAGHSGSVVRLFAGEWRIYLPNRLDSSNMRLLRATFTPNDPFPDWDASNNYRGLINDNFAEQSGHNLRDSLGDAIIDASDRQFARLLLDPGTRPSASTALGTLLHWLKKEPI
jgi:hypothetical protein